MGLRMDDFNPFAFSVSIAQTRVKIYSIVEISRPYLNIPMGYSLTLFHQVKRNAPQYAGNIKNPKLINHY